jgi:hypothetical protein
MAMSNFSVSVNLHPSPWPFSWGPFHTGFRHRTFRCAGAELFISQAGAPEGDPITIGCCATGGACTTTVDFRGGSRLKRKTAIPTGSRKA